MTAVDTTLATLDTLRRGLGHPRARDAAVVGLARLATDWEVPLAIRRRALDALNEALEADSGVVSIEHLGTVS